MRQLHDLATSFEQPRLEPPPHIDVVETVTQEAAEVAAEETVEVAAEAELDLSTLLANIFDAADEALI